MRAVNVKFDGANMRISFTKIDVEADSSEAKEVLSGVLNRAGFEILPPRPANSPAVSAPKALPEPSSAAPSPPVKRKAAGAANGGRTDTSSRPKTSKHPAAPVTGGTGKRSGPAAGTLANDIILVLTTGPRSTAGIVAEIANHGRTTTEGSVEGVIYSSLRTKFGYKIEKDGGKWHLAASR